MRSKRTIPVAAATAAVLLGAAGVWAQETPLPKNSIKFNVDNSPLSLVSASYDQSRSTARGAAMVLDLDIDVTLRNTSPNRIRGITLRVTSQEAFMGGKGSVTRASLNVGQGESFTVPIQMQLVRPTQVSAGPLVQVDLDGVLFQDLSFYGTDRLNSRRYLTACETEAQRDREHFKQILARQGKDGLAQAMRESIDRQKDLPALDVRVRHGNGAAVASAGLASEHEAQFAFLQFPDSPVRPLGGSVRIAGNQASEPEIDVRNTSSKAVRYVEFGWVVSDPAGRQYMAGALPSSDANLYLPPGSQASVRQDSSLKFSANGQPVNVQKMTGFVSQVEFVDGKVWVPNRQSLNNPLLQKVLAPSVEEQRLSVIYRSKGIDALVEDLKKF